MSDLVDNSSIFHWASSISRYKRKWDQDFQRLQNMAQKEKFPMKTPDGEEKKITEKERAEGGYGMAKKEGVVYPPAKKEGKK
jgi:hypothetical protein